MLKFKRKSDIAGIFMSLVLFTSGASSLTSYAKEIIENDNVIGFTIQMFEEGGYEANITVPQINGLLDDKLEQEININLMERAESVMNDFEEEIKELKEVFGEEETIHMAVETDYRIRTDNEKIIVIDFYVYYASGSSNITHTFYTIDKSNKKLISLDSLFLENSDYITPISEYIKTEMTRINEHENGMYWIADNSEFEAGFDKIKSDQTFYINSENELVICFEKYEVSAGAQGSPEFVIPIEIVANILNTDLL